MTQFLTHLAVAGHVAASTQNQAFNALLFLYKRVLEKDLGLIQGVTRAKKPKRLPVVLNREEVKLIFAQLSGTLLLICRLLYGSGMRLFECLQMRVKDIDFTRNEITVRDGKGRKDRVTMLPASCKQALLEHLEKVRRLHEADLDQGLGQAPLPDALDRKYPNADRSWGWQYVFPASSHYTDRRTRLPASAPPARKRGPKSHGRRRTSLRRQQTGHAAHAAECVLILLHLSENALFQG